MKQDIILSGVGGQGILSIATVIGKAALDKGLYIKQAEVHGMSQRGGSVVTYVRFGEKVYSPIIDKGEADYIVSFELLEAARWIAGAKEYYLQEFRESDGVLVQGLPGCSLETMEKYRDILRKKMKNVGIRGID